MKIWLKITLLVILISTVILHVTLNNVRSRMEEQVLTLNGERLKTLAVSASSLIDGDTYKMIDFRKTYLLEKNEYYINTSNLIKKLQSNLGDKEEIFTLSKVNDDEAIFGVMSDKFLCVGDTLHLISKKNKKALNQVYNLRKPQYTKIYSDQYGMWVSGLAPILDSGNNVVGAVQVDRESTFIYQQINEIDQYINYIRLVFLPVIILFSIVLSRMITKPINNVIKAINNISNGDYRKPPQIKSYGEVKNLVESTEQLRCTILEQQTKIFDTIKELRGANLELEKAKASIESLDKLKSEFLALISHEVRTPINVIKGNLDIIKMENDDLNPAEMNYFFHTIDLEFNRLIRTIDGVVTLAELHSGTYLKKEEEFDLLEIVYPIYNEYKQHAHSKMVEVHLNLDSDEYILTADQYAVQQVITNIIDNAVKFTHKGSVEINISSKNESEIIFEVSDTGVGISKDFFPNLFKPFFQEDSGYSRKYEGNGLGLALIKKCADLNEALIEIDSEKGIGTRFAVVFVRKEKYKLKSQPVHEEIKVLS